MQRPLAKWKTESQDSRDNHGKKAGNQTEQKDFSLFGIRFAMLAPSPPEQCNEHSSVKDGIQHGENDPGIESKTSIHEGVQEVQNAQIKCIHDPCSFRIRSSRTLCGLPWPLSRLRMPAAGVC